jgi:hypothetical protein
MPASAVRASFLILLTSGLVLGCAPVASSLPTHAHPTGEVVPLAVKTVSLDANGGRGSLGGGLPPMTSVQWGGQLGPQEANPLIPSTHIIDAATHPLATLNIPNPSPTAETFAIDLFVADQGPPASFYGSSSGIARQDWPGVIWDWAPGQQSLPGHTVTVAARTSDQVHLDWPQTGANGRPVPIGKYWAVVTAVPINPSARLGNFEEESPIDVATSLPPLPRENCLGYPAAATVSGLPSPYPVALDPMVNVPGAEIVFAGIRTGDRCVLTGADPEVGILAFTNPWATPVGWSYDVGVSLSDAHGNPQGSAYCDARYSSPAVSSGGVLIAPHGVATASLAWPHCTRNALPPPARFYSVVVTATASMGWTSGASEVVYLAS